jgi:uncharacterized membrane protein YfcA
MEGVIALSIPIVSVVVTAVVIITIIYFNYRKQQLLIEKGFSAEEIKEMFKTEKDRFILLKIGIISIFFGLGLGFGLMLEDWMHKTYYVPLLIFVGTGIGFILANYYGRKLNDRKVEAEN